ncbi:Retinol dehydrogenase 14 [Cytospora mali]|uniref:Retinol dehydrogenase 14 n=1 Tax=Cytospora mali TaxID=578113 RepID=A0A194UMU3_CYTMA|nr:Retinol dehydrogenase 14 [Valsa mali var. pyri (nom. inval.)]
MPTLGDFVNTQFLLKIPEPSVSFAQKTVIVTGANGGLGKEIVKHIIRLGASKVICGCRSLSRGAEAKKEIEAMSKCTPDIIEVWELDLESPQSIRGFVKRANGLPRLDVVINLAGVRCFNFQVVYDTERTLAINNIGTFLFALPLIPKLKETARKFGTTPVMTIVGSALYDRAKYPDNPGEDIFAYFKDKTKVNPWNQYNLSKLIQLYTLIKLATLVDPVDDIVGGGSHPIVINSVDPCFCETGLSREVTGVTRLVVKTFAAIAARPADDGARQIVHAASCGRETHGLYLRAGAVQAYKPIAQDDQKTEYLWENLSKRLKKIEPTILENLE